MIRYKRTVLIRNGGGQKKEKPDRRHGFCHRKRSVSSPGFNSKKRFFTFANNVFSRLYSIVEQNGMRDICILLDYSLLDLRKLEAEFEKDAQEKEDDEEVSFDFKRAAGVMAKVGKKVAKKTASTIAEEGNDFAHAVAGGIGFVGSKISSTLATAKKVREENEALREELGKMTLSETVKQKVIMQLNDKVSFLKKQLDEERQRNKKNEEIILLLEEQIADLAATIEIAEKAKVE